jgi:hypothetical protein
LRATGRLAGAFLGLAFAFFLAAMLNLPAGDPACPKRVTDIKCYSTRLFA